MNRNSLDESQKCPPNEGELSPEQKDAARRRYRNLSVLFTVILLAALTTLLLSRFNSVDEDAGFISDVATRDDVFRADVDENVDFIITDVADTHWAKSYVDSAVQMGIVEGNGSSKFYPDNEVTRAEFITLLWKAAGKPQPTAELSISDIDETSWYYSAAVWGVENGYIKCTDENTFLPNTAVTRAQAITILYRFAGSPRSGGSLDTFADGNEVSDYARNAMYWATVTGIITASTDNKLFPQQNATRAQAVAFIVRYCRC